MSAANLNPRGLRDARAAAPLAAGTAPLHAGTTVYSLREAPDAVVANDATSAESEQFRRLVNYLTDPSLAPNQAIAVTSALPGDGKSLVSLNLALAMAKLKAGDTLLIDADLRREGLSSLIAPTPRRGLFDVLADPSLLDETLLALDGTRLAVLPSGSSDDGPAPEISVDRILPLVARLRERYARIVIDTPPVIPFSDALALKTIVDGFLIVVRAGYTPQSKFLEAVEHLDRARIFGVTLNGAVPNMIDSRDAYYYHHVYYGKKRR